ncbi:APC family permease [Streptomyces albireticuli]|uniref:Amino acid permease n=1 Tax=Streptomyces albireticuli TaxID=1940 RepID=A0A2A2D9R8_9ACTN|nr:APC family permease [Streptomyces albireticuli]MCD9142632.1 APC family permease [Streptomyces albireticuli]MCD9164031.1 APC family permease [Streptomyces albireticuli]MCD9192760.1 APC family permease [Streptomyces albireticuli]PAU48119.1 amino acid permease [Streptomyces albireticuli]
MAQPADERGRTGLRRTLTFRDLVVYGLLFIAPMAPVGVFGTLDAKSHGAVALVYVVATVAMAFTAFSYAQMVRVAPQAGSVYTYARVGLGEGPGFVAGWMAMLDYLLIPAVAYLFSGIAMNALVPEVSRWVWTAVAVVVTTGLNLWGVRAAARVGFLVLAMEIAVLLVFVASAVFALAEKGTRRDWLSPLTGDGGLTTGAVFAAVSVAVLSYLGFDAIAAFAEESAGGSARVARAVMTCLAVAGVLFVAQTYLAALLAPMTPAELAADPAAQGSAFYDTVDAATGTWLHDLVAASKAIGAAFAALAGQAAAGRLLFAMARDRRLPAPLAKVDSGSGVPRPALLGAAVVTLVAAVWAARRDDGLDRLVSVVNVGALVAFALLHLSVIGWFAVRKRGGPASPVRHVVVPLLGLAVVIAVVVKAAATAQIVGGVWLAVGLGVLITQRFRGRAAGMG